MVGGGGGGEEPEEGDGCHLVGLVSVAKARVVLVASGRVETVRLTLTCGDPMHSTLIGTRWHYK